MPLVLEAFENTRERLRDIANAPHSTFLSTLPAFSHHDREGQNCRRFSRGKV
jgi:hypothetical protein